MDLITFIGAFLKFCWTWVIFILAWNKLILLKILVEFHLEEMSWGFKSQTLEKIKVLGQNYDEYNVSLVLFYVLPDMFTYKLEFRIARGMVKNWLCQGSSLISLRELSWLATS